MRNSTSTRADGYNRGGGSNLWEVPAMSTIRRTRPKRLNFSAAGVAMSPGEFDSIRHADPRFRFELIRGIIVVSRYPSFNERDPNEELGYFLRYYRDSTVSSTLDLTLPECDIHSVQNRRRAERVVWAGLGRLPDPEVDLPAIAIEFVSRSRRGWLRDYEEKRGEYLALGIAEYWVIDRFARTMTVYRTPPAEPLEVLVPADGIYRTPLLPGFELPLAVLFKTADRWPVKKRATPRTPDNPQS